MNQPNFFNTVTRKGVVLRPYQEEFIAAADQAFEHDQSGLGVMATGLGKTYTAVEWLRRRGGRAMWIGHRGELVDQAAQAIGELTGVLPQVEMAERAANMIMSGDASVVASVQTLNAKRRGEFRMNKFLPSMFNTLITDEAHHAVASTWLRVAQHFTQNTELKHMGLTATPDRGDEEALGQVYGTCFFRYDINNGVGDGWLVPIMIERIFIDSINLTAVRKLAGDFNKSELAAVMEQDEAMHGVAETVLSEVGDKKSLLFTSSVAQAKGLADILNVAKSGSATSIDGKTPKDERAHILREYRNGSIQYLCNVGIATEGFDVPSIECIVMAAPTMSRSKYAQMMGRGTRPLAGVVDGHNHAEQRHQSIADSAKPNMLLLDFTGNSGKHKLISAADVLGGNFTAEVVERANEEAANESLPIDTLELLRRAEALVNIDAEKDRIRQMRKATQAKVDYRKTKIDPFDVLDIEPPLSDSEWKVKPLTAGQKNWLTNAGMDLETMSPTAQRKVLNEMIRRKEKNLATPKQVRLLKQFGYDSTNMTFTDASSIITQLANNGWKRLK